MISINWTTTYNHFIQSPFLWEIIKFMGWLVGTKHVPESKNTSRIQNTSHNPVTLLRIQKHVPESKTRPKIQNMSQKPQTLPRIQNTYQNRKTRPRIQSTSQKPKTLPRIQNTSQNPKVFWNLGSILDSWVCFWFFGMGFGFLQVFWDSRTCFGFWEVFCPYEPQWVQVLSVRSGHPGPSCSKAY